ncbi:hypothetical protein [Hoylesella saccharolytica]
MMPGVTIGENAIVDGYGGGS